jgi:threonyl-tRNA synthetase
VVVGKREAEERTVALRQLGSDRQQIIKLDDLVTMLAQDALPPDLK